MEKFQPPCRQRPCEPPRRGVGRATAPNSCGRRVRRCVAAALLAGLAPAGCTVGPDYHRPGAPAPGGWGELPAAATQPAGGARLAAAAPVVRWWATFQDPALDRLIDRAAGSNLDVRRARARVRESRAQAGVARAGLFPAANASGSYNHSRSSAGAIGTFPGTTGGTTGGGDTGGGQTGGGAGVSQGVTGFGGETDIYQAGFDASWEIDVFGGVRRGVEAADADTAAAVEDLRDVQVTLLGDVARYYIELRGSQRQIAIARDNLLAQQQTLDISRDRVRAGLNSELDAARAEAQVATTASQIPALESAARQAIHRLGVLLGLSPLALSAELSEPKTIPRPPPEVPVGMPSDLLRRRPDVRRAERQLAAATARVGVATADLFPKFSLTGSLGTQGLEPGDLFNYSSRFYSIGPSIRWPVFDAGRIRAAIRVQDARTEQALAAYEQAVLTALREVEDALVAYTKEEDRRRTLAAAADANRRAADLATELYTAGRTDFLSVLQAQRDLFASQDALVQSDRTVSTALVALYKALGGGWQTFDPPATRPAE